MHSFAFVASVLHGGEVLERLRKAAVQALFVKRQGGQRIFWKESTRCGIARPDPLCDIRNVGRIAAVVIYGNLIARAEIDRIVTSHRRLSQ